jgi:hypothetical protein
MVNLFLSNQGKIFPLFLSRLTIKSFVSLLVNKMLVQRVVVDAYSVTYISIYIINLH